MKLLILTVLAAVVQTAVPVPRQTADNPTQATANIKNKSTEKQKYSPQTQSSLKAGGNRPSESDGNQQGANNAEHTIGISKLPPVSIARDWADWGVWLFSLLLVVVGVLQALLLRQHKKDFTEIAVAANKSADAALAQIQILRNRERARLKVSHPHFDPRGIWSVQNADDDRIEQALDVRVVVTNEGQTGAFNVSAMGDFTALPADGTCATSARYKIGIPAVIRADTSEILVRLEPSEVGMALLPGDDWTAVQNGSKALHVFGTILYDDVFDEKWSTPFHFVWRVFRYGDEPGDEEAEWKDISPAGGRIDSGLKNQNPN